VIDVRKDIAVAVYRGGCGRGARSPITVAAVKIASALGGRTVLTTGRGVLQHSTALPSTASAASPLLLAPDWPVLPTPDWSWLTAPMTHLQGSLLNGPFLRRLVIQH
jgi:hypothetical protein